MGEGRYRRTAFVFSRRRQHRWTWLPTRPSTMTAYSRRTSPGRSTTVRTAFTLHFSGIQSHFAASLTSLYSACYGGCKCDTSRICWMRLRAAAPLMGARRPPLSIDISCPPAPSSKPAARHYCGRWMGQTDRRTDGYQTVELTHKSTTIVSIILA